MRHSELAWELVDLFDELQTDEINQALANNVPLEVLEFFSNYANSFAKTEEIQGTTRLRLPNLMILGYLLRLLEERVLEAGD